MVQRCFRCRTIPKTADLVTDVDTIDAGFDDILALAADCRFNDCVHGGEPGCEVAAAVADGRLSEDRFSSWEKLRREAESARVRADPAAHHQFDRDRTRMYRTAINTKNR